MIYYNLYTLYRLNETVLQTILTTLPILAADDIDIFLGGISKI